VITHPEYRRQGIVTKIMRNLLETANEQRLGLVLIDGSGYSDIYERFGFTAADPTSDRLMYWSRREHAPSSA